MTDNEKRILRNTSVASEPVVIQISDKPYDTVSSSFTLDVPSTPGYYVLEIKPLACTEYPAEKVTPSYLLQLVSHLRLVVVPVKENQKEVQVFDAWSGMPVPGAIVNEYELDRKTNQFVFHASQTTDKEGKYVYVKKGNKTIYLSAQDGKDRVRISDLTVYYPREQRERVEKNANLYTDRSIYRPGQDVEYSVILWQQRSDTTKVLPNELVQLVLAGGRKWTQISKDTLTTDSYGVAHGTFHLPEECLPGNYSITTDAGFVNFMVEEYKRPTFDVKWLPCKVDYAKGDTVLLTGQASLFSDLPVQHAKVAIKVVRRQRLWWRIMDEAVLKEEVVITDEKGTFRATEPGYIQFTYDHPVTVRSIELFPSANNIQTQRLLVQASTDENGTSFTDVRQLTPPRQGWQNTNTLLSLRHNANHYTYALPETTAKHFRFIWTPANSEPGAEDLDAAKWSPVLKMNAIRLSAQPVVDQYESLNGSFWRKPNNLSNHIGTKGFSNTKKPTALRILRIGHASTGHTNATAGGAKGLECDKFSAAAVSKQVDSWFGAFMQRPHSNVVKFMHVDSWECGSQNWSRNFAAEFQKRRGYDLLPFLPVYAGAPIDAMPDAQALGLTSERVLRDIRLTINDLLQEVFFATINEKARQYGVQLSAESVAPTMISDGMQHYKAVDAPMGEFWLNSPTHDKPNDMLDAISGAHIYGKNIVQAEGFTEVRGVWDETPASIKTLLDRNFALGMNRLFFHVFTHNPWTNKKPGMTLDGIGLFFQRDQTWMPEAKAFVDYITRCQQLLQQGTPVVDIAVYTGDDMPRRAWRPEQLVDILPGFIGAERVAAEHKRLANIGQPMEESPVGVKHSANIADPVAWVNALNGYSYDSMNPDALMTSRYPVLVVPQCLLISPETRNCINELKKQGVIVIDEPLNEPVTFISSATSATRNGVSPPLSAVQRRTSCSTTR